MVALGPVCSLQDQFCNGSGDNAIFCEDYLVRGIPKEDLRDFLQAKVDPVKFAPDGTALSVVELDFSLASKRQDVPCLVANLCWTSPNRPGFEEPCQENDFSISFGVRSEQRLTPQSFFSTTYRCREGTGADPNELVVTPFENGTVITDGRCNIVGCPILRPRGEYKRVQCLPTDFVDKDYFRMLTMLIGTTNEFPQFGCDPCEMLLTGVTGQKQSLEGVWRMTFCWAISPNVIRAYDLFCGFTISGMPEFETVDVPIGGWDHVRPIPHPSRDSTNPNVCNPFTIGVDVHQVYSKADHLAAGIF